MNVSSLGGFSVRGGFFFKFQANAKKCGMLCYCYYLFSKLLDLLNVTILT